MNYYNENDPKAAAWLRELIKAGEIPAGDVDTRSILEIKASELHAYTQCHFFAGIGGWSLALRLVLWPESRPVWTGSCPCQPFSDAGAHKGEADPRHLWPAFRDLIAAGGPAVAFGEQVASKAGRDWLAGVRADLEGMAYDVGAADLCAASVDAPHRRQRIYWVADAGASRRGALLGATSAHGDAAKQPNRHRHVGGLAHAAGSTHERSIARANIGMGEGLVCEKSGRMDQSGGQRGAPGVPESPSGQTRVAGIADHSGNPRNFWGAFDLLPCTDGKTRRVEPGSFPLAHGIPGRVGLLRGYGNAIVPQLAAEFIRAYREARGEILT